MAPMLIGGPFMKFGGGGANPFLAGFRGHGTLGRNTTAIDATPPAGTQAGDLLVMANVATSVAGWSAYSTATVRYNFFSRIATGDANDNVPSASCSNFGCLIWGYREGVLYNNFGATTINNRITESVWNWEASTALLGQELTTPQNCSRLYFYAGYASSLSTALSVTPDEFFTKDTEVIDDSFKFVTVFGHYWAVPTAIRSSFSIPYAAVTSGSKARTHLALKIELL